jgi:tryptophan 2,3-dioxygenase
MALTYSSYLKVDDLLTLQQLQSSPEEHDELLFIIIHQTYELWFKQILHELDKLRSDLENARIWEGIKTLKRILKIMKTLVQQVDILETMTPLDFNSFRGFLQNSSGFQSIQFRAFEIICGLRYKMMFDERLHQAEHISYLKQKTEEHTLWESFIMALQHMQMPAETPQRENEQGLIYNPSEANQKLLVDLMKTQPKMALLCELMVDFDEGLQEWRYRHVKMVERTIGTKQGTGGSDGAKYLRNTLHQPIFPDLWAIRALF